MKVKDAINVIYNELNNNSSYREAWKANIAMAYKDHEKQYKMKTGKKYLNRKDVHIIANNAAEYFLTILTS